MGLTTDNIDRVAINASLAAYGIKGGEFENSPFGKKLGFLGDVATFEAGKLKQDACFIAETKEHIHLSFRGTTLISNPNKIKVAIDWLNNSLANPTDIEELNGEKDEDGKTAKAHKGFNHSVDRLLKIEDSNKNTIKLLLQEKSNKNKPLIISGYSKGGALAAISALKLFHQNSSGGLNFSKVYLRTFASAVAGNTQFNTKLKGTKIDIKCYTYNLDIVPHLPANIKLLKERLESTYEKIRDILEGTLLDALDNLDFENWGYSRINEQYYFDKNDELSKSNIIKDLDTLLQIIAELKSSCSDSLGEECVNKLKSILNDHDPSTKLYKLVTNEDFPTISSSYLNV